MTNSSILFSKSPWDDQIAILANKKNLKPQQEGMLRVLTNKRNGWQDCQLAMRAELLAAYARIKRDAPYAKREAEAQAEEAVGRWPKDRAAAEDEARAPRMTMTQQPDDVVRRSVAAALAELKAVQRPTHDTWDDPQGWYGWGD